MNQYSKITPKFGKNIYGLWSCESLEYNDPEKEKIIQPLRSDPKKVSIKQMFAFRKLNIITCMDCKHYISHQCLFSREEIEQAAKKYKKGIPTCSNCSLPLTFHQCFLQNNHHVKLCVTCKEAKINGTLSETQKIQKIRSKLATCEVITILFLMVFIFSTILFDGVFDWGDYIAIGFFSLLIFGFSIYFLIKRRKKRKLEEA